MIIRNDTSCHIFFALQEGRQETEEALTLMFSKSYEAFIVLLAEKRIYIYKYCATQLVFWSVLTDQGF